MKSKIMGDRLRVPANRASSLRERVKRLQTMVLQGALLPMLLIFSPSVQAREQPPGLQKLLHRSNPEEQVRWALRYEHGEGVERDPARAISLYCAAARKGHVQAQYQLGWLYANGRGVERDDGLAAAWFRLAAAKGDEHARRMLARIDDPNARGQKATCVGGIPTQAKKRRQMVRSSSPSRRKVEQLVLRLAPNYRLDPALVMAVIEIESGFRAHAVSPKNAQGLMQLIPGTAERFGVRNTMDPEQNLRGGMAYLRWLLKLFKGDVRLALASYNAGEQAVAKYGGIPPYPETRKYVATIIDMYGRTNHPMN
jgi:soluble lytic murein transglycosylase-like protein